MQNAHEYLGIVELLTVRSRNTYFITSWVHSSVFTERIVDVGYPIEAKRYVEVQQVLAFVIHLCFCQNSRGCRESASTVSFNNSAYFRAYNKHVLWKQPHVYTLLNGEMQIRSSLLLYITVASAWRFVFDTVFKSCSCRYVMPRALERLPSTAYWNNFTMTASAASLYLELYSP